MRLRQAVVYLILTSALFLVWYLKAVKRSRADGMALTSNADECWLTVVVLAVLVLFPIYLSLGPTIWTVFDN